MSKPKFHIYKFEFICDYCGEKSYMGQIGYSQKYHKVCDLCLINQLYDEDNGKEDTNIPTTNSPNSPKDLS